MKLHRTLSLLAITALAGLFPTLASAAFTLTPSPNDLSFQYLSDMFGVVSGVLHGSGTQIFGHLFDKFNSAVLALGGIVVSYTFMLSTINTAAEGEIMGKNMSSIWVPIRSAGGIALLLPKGTGYCAIQVFMMWVVVQGIGAADRIWETTLDYLAQGGVIIQQSAAGFKAQSRTNLGGGAQANAMLSTGQLFIDTVCLQSLQNNLPTTGNASKLDLFALVNAQLSYYQAQVSNGGATTPTVKVSLPWGTNPATQALASSFPGTSSITPASNACGSMDITLPQGSANIPLALARLVAAQQMILDLQGAAMEVQTSYAATSALGTFPSLGFDNCGPAVIPQMGTGSAVASPAPCSGSQSQWETGTLPPDLFQNVLSDYIGIVYAASQTEGQSDGTGAGVASISQTVVAQAKQDGWLMAGRYYIDLANANNNANAFSNAWGTTFPITVNPPNWTGGIMSTTQPAPKAQRAVNQYINGAMNYYVSDGNVGTMNQKVNQGIAAGVAGIVSIAAIAAPFLIPILTGIIDIFLGMGDLLTAQQTNLNPITAIAVMGGGLMNVSVGFFIMGAIAAFALGVGLGAVPCVDLSGAAVSLIAWVAPLMTGLVGIMFTTGAMMAYYIPMIPFLLFTFGTIGWLVTVIEAMVAAPLVALGITHPEGHQAFGKGEHALLLIANVFLKPSLMLFGYIGGISMSYVGLWILNRGFMAAFYETIGNMLTQGTVIGSIFALIGIPLASVCFYTIAAMIIVQKAFSLIHAVPERVLKWIGGSIEGNMEAQMEQETKAGMQKAYQAQGQMMQTGAQGTSKAAEEARGDKKKDAQETRKQNQGGTAGKNGAQAQQKAPKGK